MTTIRFKRLKKPTVRRYKRSKAIDRTGPGYRKHILELEGTGAGRCKWFHGDIVEHLITRKWACFDDDCWGTFKDTGCRWMTTDPGIHHSCQDCGLTIAIPQSVLEQVNTVL